MTITSASANSAIQYANNSQDYSSVTGGASLNSIISTQPTVSPSSLAPKPNNHLIAKAALIGATLGLVGPLAAPMLGNMAKSAFGFAKNLLPQAGDVGTSDMARNVVGSMASHNITKK